MTDLIFYIGLAKCASSTLQRSVFRNEDGYQASVPVEQGIKNFVDWYREYYA